ncbi:MAG: NUDIX hydrolase [Candidatus Dormibacteraeota bacterium]|nr:NUDIX hydrolase [Candidatus Dormibacteraeota bacterium]
MTRVIGAQAVILDSDGRVLLQFRSWPPGWEPPGGHVAAGEDPAATVVRETREECGLEVEIVRQVGTYHFRGIRVGQDAVFLARPVGGRPRRSREALRLTWADPLRLPAATFPWFRQRIRDALAGGPPVERWQEVNLVDVLRHGAALLAEPLRAGRGGL